MKVSEIMVTDIVALTSEDTVAKALNLMADRSINQIPIVDENGKYLGMIFAKQIINSTAQPSSKLKSYIVSTSTLSAKLTLCRQQTLGMLLSTRSCLAR